MPYPQKCLLYLSVAFAGLNAGLLFHAVAPREDIVCQRIEEGGGSGGGSYLTVEGHRNALCFLTFVLVYFFSLCTSSWMISTLTAWWVYLLCPIFFPYSLNELGIFKCLHHQLFLVL